VEDISKILDEYEKETGNDIPIHGKQSLEPLLSPAQRTLFGKHLSMVGLTNVKILQSMLPVVDSLRK